MMSIAGHSSISSAAGSSPVNGTARTESEIPWLLDRQPNPDNHALIDEYRVVDDAGKTVYVTTTLRAFDPRDHNWRIASIERLMVSWSHGLIVSWSHRLIVSAAMRGDLEQGCEHRETMRPCDDETMRR
jgi:hypothetical protein